MERVALHSPPRSGSTWLGEIFNSNPAVKYCYQPLFSYSLKSFLDEKCSKSEIDEFFDRLLATEDEFILQTQQRRDGLLPAFRKSAPPTHVVYKEVRYHHLLPRMAEQEPALRFVLLIRNPLEVMASWISAPKEFKPEWSVDGELLKAELKNGGRPEEFYGLLKWIEATNLFLRLAQDYRDRVLIVEYRELEQRPVQTVEQIFRFCGLDFDAQTAGFLQDSQTKARDDAYSVFRGNRKRDAWKETLSEANIALIRRQVSASGLARFLQP